MKFKKENGRTMMITICTVIVIVFIYTIMLSTMMIEKNSNSTKLADGFTIDSYNVNLNVKKDNKIEVTENITVDWYEGRHHGIYKFTPEWLEYTSKNGKTMRRKSIISNLMAVGENYSIDWVKKKARIKIGSASKYVDLGLKTYSIKYTYDMGKDLYKGFDEFIFHAFGDYWGTEIKNATITINMPKSIDKNAIKFYADKYRKEDITKYVDCNIDGNTIVAKLDRDLYLKEEGKILEKSLTTDIELPEGYFEGGSFNYGWKSFRICLYIFLSTVILYIIWLIFGKDFDKKSTTVEFYSPDNLSSAEVGYVYNGRHTNKKLTISLIISLASKGYIKINQLEDNNIQIINLLGGKFNKPELQENLMPTRKFEVKKLKDADDMLSSEGKALMAYMFKNDNIKEMRSNIDQFLRQKDELVNGGYIEVLNDNEKDREISIEEIQKNYEEQLKEYNHNVKEYEEKLKHAPKLNEYEEIVYKRLFETTDYPVLSEHTTFYHTFEEVNKKLKKDFKNKIHDKKSRTMKILSIIVTIISLILSIYSYVFVEDLNPNIYIMYYMSFACVIINLFFTIIMERKTIYGEEIKAKVLGFRDFLNKAEKNQLEQLVESTPTYFYDILPYTYVLNLSKKWISKFENIPMPEMDMGNFDYSSDKNYNDLYYHIYTPESDYSSSSGSSGCSSCGGGCSSCGGGCSSCGGGGSW